MPRLSHEALVQLVRNAPELVLTLLGHTARDRDARPVHVTAAEFTDLNFAEHRADVVLTIGGSPTAPDEAFVVEVQGEADPRKRISWPLYVAGARTRLACPVTLVVLALDPAVARWCARPIDLGRGRCVLHPWVLGPADIPVITDLELARAAPELAVLSVAAHADDPGAEHIALAALAAAHTLDNNRAVLYPDFVIALLGAVARAALEKLMATTHYEFQSDFARGYFAEGKSVGKAETLLKLLQLRGFIVPEAEQGRVLACRDLDRLDAWVARVLTARDLDEVLAD